MEDRCESCRRRWPILALVAAVILATGIALSGGIYTGQLTEGGIVRMNRWTGETWAGDDGGWIRVPDSRPK